MKLLKSALEEVAKGPDAMAAWIDQHPESHEAAFLDEAKRYATAAMQAGQFPAALAANVLVTTIHMHRGDREGALRSKLQEVEVLYMLAETEEAYEQAYDIALSLRRLAGEAGLAVPEFWATTLAADSAYWCSTVVAGDGQRRGWLRKALDLLRRTDPPAREDAAGPWSRFVSGLVATYQTVTGEGWGADQDAVTAELRELATLVERRIPADFAFDDPQKTAHAAHHLSDLSARFGDRQAAAARQRAVQQGVKHDEWGE